MSPQISYTGPPITGNLDLDRYLLELHNRLFGVGSDTLGDLDSDNGVIPDVDDSVTSNHVDSLAIKDSHIDWGTGDNQINTDDMPEGSTNRYYTDERVDDRAAALIQDGEALTWTYDDGAGSLTGEVTKGAAVSDAAASTVDVTSADADAVYGTEERDLINEMKSDINTLVTDLNSAITQYNSLMANLRTAKLLVT